MYEFMHHLRMTSDLTDAGRAIAFKKPYGFHVSTAFLPVNPLEVEHVFQLVNFPEQLKAFYLELGTGTVQRGSSGVETTAHNYVINPPDIPKLIGGTCEWMMPYTQIQPDTIPFFERDIDLFLCVHPKSGNPNAVHWMWGEKICESAIEFFQRLVEDPDWFNPPNRES